MQNAELPNGDTYMSALVILVTVQPANIPQGTIFDRERAETDSIMLTKVTTI